MKKVITLIIRTIITIISLCFLALFIIPMFSNIINPGNIAGALLCIWLLLLSIAPLQQAIKRIISKRKALRFLYRTVNVCFAAFLIYGMIITGAMVYFANQAPSQNATAIVLGAQVRPWGPSVILQGRINSAETYLKNNTDANAVLTGGQGSDEPMSEAQSMYETLINQGISADRLYKEDKAVNTTENMKFSMKIIEDKNLNGDIAIVTDGFHQLRAGIIAHQLGIKGNVGAICSDTNKLYLPTYAVREWFALPFQVLFR